MRIFTIIVLFLITNNCSAQTTFCIPNPSSGINGYDILNIHLQSLNVSAFPDVYNLYSDSLSTTTCYLIAGASYKLYITNGGHAVSTLAAWADWNCDTSFNNTSEKLGEVRTGAMNELDSISFTVPTTSLMGKLTLRVRISNSTSINSCSNYTSGQIVDFTITVLNPDYEYNFYTNWDFSNTGNDFIDGVVLETINNLNSGSINGPVYGDYSFLSTDLVSCNDYYLHITASIVSASDSVKAYIDFNDNGIFEFNELLGNLGFPLGVSTDSIMFHTPAVSGDFRLRIINYTPGNITEVEDYTVNVTSSSLVGIPNAQIGSDLFYDCTSGCTFYGCTGQNVFHDFTCEQTTFRSWSIPGASPATSTSKNPTFSFSSPGLYNITLIDSNSFGSDTAFSQVTISGPVTNINLGNNTTICNNDSLLLSAPAGIPSVDCYSYLWSTGATTREIYVKVAGTYFVKLTSCHHTDCSAADTITVSFSPLTYSVTGGGTSCSGGPGYDVSLDDSETGVDYQLYFNGNPVGPIFPGTGSAISFGVLNVAGAYTVRATNTAIACTAQMSGTATIVYGLPPASQNVNGGGSCCAGGPGLPIGIDSSESNVSYQLYVDGNSIGGPITGNGSAINFPNHSNPGNYTVIATSTVGGCTTTMAGSADIVANPGPASFNVTGGGSFCAGSSGTTITLSGSQSGILYELFHQGTPTGTILTGNDSLLIFPPQFSSGNYTIVATNDSACSSTMNGSATLNLIPSPTPFVLAGGANYCAGDTFGHLTLSSSELGVRYQMYVDNLPIGNSLNGTGDSLDFGVLSIPGTYSVIGSNTVSICHLPMIGNPVITVNPLPLVYNVTGGGHYCIGSSGIEIGLSNSDTSSIYQLISDNNPVGGPFQGTGTALDFGFQLDTGAYIVIATNLANSCSATMNNVAYIYVDTVTSPVVFNVIGGGHYCKGGAGLSIGLTNSDSGFSYQLNHNNVPVGSPIQGTGSSINFSQQTLSGIYTISAMAFSSTCSAFMSGSAIITIDSLPVLYITSFLPDTICIYQSPVPLAGNPHGGTFTGDGVLQDTLYPVVAGVKMAVVSYNYTDPITGCSNTVSDSIRVDMCIGVDEFELAQTISLYPNPANSEFIIQLPSMINGKVAVEIINSIGQTVKYIVLKADANNSSFVIDSSDLSEGIFIVKFDFDKQVVSKRMQVLR